MRLWRIGTSDPSEGLFGQQTERLQGSLAGIPTRRGLPWAAPGADGNPAYASMAMYEPEAMRQKAIKAR